MRYEIRPYSSEIRYKIIISAYNYKRKKNSWICNSVLLY